MEIDDLITEMQEVRVKYPTLEIQDILRLFTIQAMRDLTKTIWRASKR